MTDHIAQLGKRRDEIERLRAPGLLLLLGIPKADIYFESESGVKARAAKRISRGTHHHARLTFWERDYKCLLDFFHIAKKGYIRRMKAIHPDVAIGKEAETATLNQIWTRLKNLYKKHGLI